MKHEKILRLDFHRLHLGSTIIVGAISKEDGKLHYNHYYRFYPQSNRWFKMKTKATFDPLNWTGATSIEITREELFAILL
jgi:hypothetical protein